MRHLKIVAAGSALSVAAVMTVAAMNGSDSASRATSSPRSAVTTHDFEVGMLERDNQMLESMRISSPSSMSTMIAADGMWVDPEMIWAQEQNQAELDRMIGRP